MVSGNVVAIVLSMFLLVLILTPLAMSWQIVFDMKAQLFLIGGVTMWAFLFIVLSKTPAIKYLVGGSGSNVMLINPRDNKRMEFIIAKMRGALSYVSGRGFFITRPNDFYLQSDSKIPTAIVYGNYSISINPKMAASADRLKKIGIMNHQDLKDLVESLKEKGEEMELNLIGETVNVATVLDYFSRDDRSDSIESEIQRRGAAEAAQKMGGNTGDIFKYAMILAILMIAGAVAYVMISNSGDNTPSGMNLPNIINVPKPTPPQPPAVVTTTTVPPTTTSTLVAVALT